MLGSHSLFPSPSLCMVEPLDLFCTVIYDQQYAELPLIQGIHLMKVIGLLHMLAPSSGLVCGLFSPALPIGYVGCG